MTDTNTKDTVTDDMEREELHAAKRAILEYTNSGGSMDDPIDDFGEWLRSQDTGSDGEGNV